MTEPVVTLPPYFIATRYPGYFWNSKTERLYSIKSGVLKPLKMTKRNRFVPITSDYYQISVKGRRRYLRVDRLKKLRPIHTTIPVDHKTTATERQFQLWLNNWWLNVQHMPGQTRLGQYLINKMNPPVTDAEIFYERDPRIAEMKFRNKYVTG